MARSSPIVVTAPWPGNTTVPSGNAISFWCIDRRISFASRPTDRFGQCFRQIACLLRKVWKRTLPSFPRAAPALRGRCPPVFVRRFRRASPQVFQIRQIRQQCSIRLLGSLGTARCCRACGQECATHSPRKVPSARYRLPQAGDRRSPHRERRRLAMQLAYRDDDTDLGRRHAS